VVPVAVQRESALHVRELGKVVGDQDWRSSGILDERHFWVNKGTCMLCSENGKYTIGKA
jgi:hypothetical protein